jgi:large subunit ribosomal protein L25
MAIHVEKISATNRSELGSRANKRLRDGGKLPGVIYGHKQDVLPVSFDRKQLSDLIAKGAHIFEVDLGGKSETALIKEAQYDHLGIELLHIDLARVRLDEKVKVQVPLELKGTPKGVADGGVLQQIVMRLDVECRVLDIPEFIRHSVAEMELDSVLHLKDIKLPEGVHSLQDAELILATVREVLEVVEAPVVAEGAPEPEVIGGKKPEEGEAAEGEAAAPAKGGAAAPAAKAEKK